MILILDLLKLLFILEFSLVKELPLEQFFYDFIKIELQKRKIF